MDITQRIDAVTKIEDIRIKMGGCQSPPKSVKIELTARCNLRCKFCAVGTRNKPAPVDMDFYFFQKITEDMRISGVEEIGLFYLGEPFMNSALLIQATDWVKKSLGFPYVFLTSNATLAEPSVVKELMKLGLNSIKWSVNFADSDQFTSITQSNAGTFKKALHNIREAWGIKQKEKYGTMISASSILYAGEQKQKMEEFLRKEIRPYVDKHYWLPLYQMSMYREQMKRKLGYTPSAGNVGRLDDTTLEPLRKPIPCWSAFTEGHVRADGGLSACCFGADDRFDMGILDGTNFMRQWNCQKFQKLREAHIRSLKENESALKGTPCEVCVAYE